ncbi:DUF4806 domain-containing protein, partial [Aphis craccivora]
MCQFNDKDPITNQLSYIGGKHSKPMIKRIMSKLFTDELLKFYSFSGKKEKEKFSFSKSLISARAFADKATIIKSEDEAFNKNVSLKRSAGWSQSPKKMAQKVQLNSSNSIKQATSSIGKTFTQRPSIVKKLSYNESPVESDKKIMSK